MANLVSAWTDDRAVRLVERDGDDIRIRSVPARWSMFVTGLDETDRAAIGRDPRVTGVRQEDRYTRIDCKNRWARRDIQDALKMAARANPDAGIEILEADVSPVVRTMADVGSLEVDPEPRLGFFDLETDSRKSFDEMKTGQARILSWALCDAHGNHWEAVLEEDTDQAERRLVEDFLAACWRFDCLLAWNGDGFDFPVLQSRSEALKACLVRDGRRLPVPWHRWTWLDHMVVFKKYNMHSDGGGEQKSSFRLQHVATYLLGEGKDDFDASRTWEAWEAGGAERERLLAYNVQDTLLLPRIEDATGFLGLHLAVCHICRIFPDTHSLNATAQGDGFLLRLGTEHGYRWATKPYFEEDRRPQKFKGAYVMEPTKTGAVESVHVCDFAGLYPSIMRTWNMSPDTKVDAGMAARLGQAFRDRLLKDDRPEIQPEVEPGICQLPNRSTWFRQDTDGMFRVALDRLVAKRAEYQAQMKAETPGTPAHSKAKRLQGAFKIVANSFYGITGSPWSRFFDPELAEGVTQTGRWLLESVIAEAKARDLDPFYGDTDSVFISGAVGTMKSLVAHMNQTWGERLAPWGIDPERHHIDLDFEKTFSRIILISAKRYAGRFETYKGKKAAEDAPPEVKGLEYKRGDTIRLAREMQSEIVAKLLEPGPLPDPSDLTADVEQWRKRVLEGELALADVTVSQSLSKKVEDYVARFAAERCMVPRCGYDFGSVDKHGPKKCPQCQTTRPVTGIPAHVRVARLLEERGEPVGEGDRVSYVVVGSDDGIEAVPAGDEGALERADRIYYWERRIFPATGRILEKVYPGSHWGESKGSRKDRVLEANGQTRLDFGAAPAPRRRRKKVQRAPTAQEHAQGYMGPPRYATRTPVPKVRRRKKTNGGIVVTLQECSAAEDGGAESYRRGKIMEAIRAAIEAHPGPHPVTILITWREISGDRAQRVKVTVPTGLTMAKTPEARQSLERLAVPGSVTGF